MSKRIASEDIPRRIYKSTIERIDAHLNQRIEARPRRTKPGLKKPVKMDFNLFLVELLNVYEELKTVPIYYVNEVFEDPAEARGAEILQAAKEKRKPKAAKQMILVGEDE